MDTNENNHRMITRSKRKKTNQNPNLILQVTNSNDIMDTESDIFLELSEKFLQKLESEELAQEEVDRKIKKRRVNFQEEINLEMKDFIVPDDYISEISEISEDSDDDYNPYEDNKSELCLEIREPLSNTQNINKNIIDNLDKSEKEFSEALASYINKRLEGFEEDGDYDDEYRDKKLNNLEMKEEIFTMYQPKMQQYFLRLPQIEQQNIINIENEIKKINNEVTPMRYQLLNSDMDMKVKAIAIRKLNSLQDMDNSSGEYYKLKSYLDGLMKIPFGKYIELPITQNNTRDEITNFMVKSNKILNQAVHSHQLAKSNILQILGKWITNPQAKGSVFSILGPMGNGKTTLVKEGIAKMISRPFEFISLGGATDSSFLDGHSYTYEGALPGKIVEILKKTQCMNPVIYFDELDKVSQTPRGEEIINLLIHLTDFSQNDVFMDKYYSDIPLDLSKAVFIFSLNSLENLNPILKDRMHVIQTDKLVEKDKIIISQNYMIPKILQEINFNSQDIIIPEETIKFAIRNYSSEAGVRNLKRCYETLLEKINIWRLLNFQGDSLTELNFSTEIQKVFSQPLILPLIITEDLLKKIMEEKTHESPPPFMMYS